MGGQLSNLAFVESEQGSQVAGAIAMLGINTIRDTRFTAPTKLAKVCVPSSLRGNLTRRVNGWLILCIGTIINIVTVASTSFVPSISLQIINV